MKGFALLLTGVVLALSVAAWGGTPEGVSPGADEVAVVGSTCPTFSWAEVSGAGGYTIEVYEAAGEVLSHDAVGSNSNPVITKDVGTALSWTPSGSECLSDGVRYVWFIGARKAEGGRLNAEPGTQNSELIWSGGRVFEVSLLSDAETVEAAKELVNSYLQTDWLKTESFTTVKEEIKRDITGTVQTNGQGTIGIMGYEGTSNTLYGQGAGNWITTNTGGAGPPDENSFFGYQAGYNTTSGANNWYGDKNTFIGIMAGYTNTTGFYNTFMGERAGYSNSTGYSNTFLGLEAGYSNSTGSDNTFLGKEAGYSNSAGVTNIFIGNHAGYSNTSGNYNTFTGYYAGKCANTSRNIFIGYGAGSGYDWANSQCNATTPTGQYNVAIGVKAGNNLEIGDSNVFIGYASGKANTTGNNNSFLGYQAGYSNTEGYDNIFLGKGAGYSNTTGHHNTFVGKSSGYSNISGLYNTFIGIGTGFYNTTGSGNVFLGYLAGYNETGSNKLYIDNSNTSSPLIYGDFTDGSEMVQINGTLDTAGHDITVNKADTSAGTGPGTKNPGMSWAGTGRLNIGWGGKGGGNLIAYSKGHATRPGEFFFVFGGGPSIGKVKFAHYDGSKSRIKLSVLANGNVGFGVNEPVYPIEHSSGAHLTAGGVWVNASSREYKEGITPLTEREAMKALEGLNPVKYRYKADPDDEYVGFIAEDVPELVATNDRKSLSPMDIVAVLTKVAKELKAEGERLKAENKEMRTEVESLREENQQIRAELLQRIAVLERQMRFMTSVASK